MAINSETDSQQLVNIVSGGVAPTIVNADNAVDIGTKQIEVAEKYDQWASMDPSQKGNNAGCHQETCKIGAADFYSHE